MDSRRIKRVGDKRKAPEISGNRCRKCGRIGCEGGIKCQAIADAKMDTKEED